MVEFSESIGYTKSKKINYFTDDNCDVDSINKYYIISGTDAKIEKEYVGRIKINTCESIKVMTCGGSSTPLNNMNMKYYAYDFDKKTYIETSSQLISESERSL